MRHVVDNIFIDPTNGHMWLATFPRPYNVEIYLRNRSHPVEGRVFHVSLLEDKEAPFSYDYSRVEEVFETDGREFGAVTIGVYCKNKLLLGTIGLNLMFCNHVQTLF